MPDETQDSVNFAGSSSPGKDVKANGSPPASAKERDRKSSKSQSPNESRDAERDGKAKKRRKVNHACIYCRRSHMTCDQERPCSRCIKRNIGHLCHDEPREPKKSKYDADGAQDEEGSPQQKPSATGDLGPQDANLVQRDGALDLPSPSMSQPRPSDPSSTAPAPASSGDQSQNINNNGQLLLGYNHFATASQNAYHDTHSYHPSYMFNTSEVSDEYNLLNNFLSTSLLDDGSFYQGDEMPNFLSDPSLSNTMGHLSTANPPMAIWNQPNQLVPQPEAADGNAISRPASRLPVDKQEEKYYMTAADPAGTDPPEERMDKLLRAKYDAGLLKPYNYVKGYARLNEYMDKNYRADSRRRILQQLDKFRPKFRERMQKLDDFELVLVEMWFERKLMEYDRVFASMAIPACCWRRTGEIYRGNKEMAELIHVPTEQLRDGKLAIHDIIVEDTLVAYWEKFGAVAFDTNQKAVLTSCSLKNPDVNAKDPVLRCCFSFTVKRDNYHIPSLIIGNFLPIVSPKR